MSYKDLRRQPHRSRNQPLAWWYEETPGITVFFQRRHEVDGVLLPWSSIRAALARKDKPAPKRGKR